MAGDDIFGDAGVQSSVPDDVFGNAGASAPDASADKKSFDWGDVPSAAVSNFLPSAAKFSGSLIEPVLHPVKALTAIGQLGKGLYSKGEGLFVNQDPVKKAQDEAVADAIGQDYKDAYWGVENIKRTFSKDPVRAMADIATVGSLGRAAGARVPGVLGTAMRAVSTPAAMLDPVNAVTKTGSLLGKGLGYGAAEVVGGASGLSGSTMKQAAKAGYEGDPSIWDIPSGAASSIDGIKVVQDAISKVAEQRRLEYKSGMNQLDLNTPLNYQNVLDEINKQTQNAYVGNMPKKLSVIDALNDAKGLVRKAMSAPVGAPEHTIEGFDALKQRLDEISGTYKGTPAQKTIQDIRGAVKDTMVQHDPGYAEVMDRYSDATRNLNDLHNEVLAGRNQTPGVQIRQIIKNLDSAHKGDLMNQLSAFDPRVPNTVAGLDIKNAHGHGTAGFTSAAISTFLGHPEAALGVPLTMPSVTSRAAYYGGKLAGLPKNAINAALDKAGQYVPPVVQQMASNVSQGPVGQGVRGAMDTVSPLTDQIKKQAYLSEGRQLQKEDAKKGVVPGINFSPYKRGGRTKSSGDNPKSSINHAKQASKLILAAEKSKKMNNKQTEPLLGVDDNTVARALEVSSQHI